MHGVTGKGAICVRGGFTVLKGEQGLSELVGFQEFRSLWVNGFRGV